MIDSIIQDLRKVIDDISYGCITRNGLDGRLEAIVSELEEENNNIKKTIEDNENDN